MEEAIRRREVPGVRTSRVTYKEAGLGSADRIYLRVSRKMLAFDICAAPFGNGFFFSWWQRELPPSNALGCLAMVFLFGALGALLRFLLRARELAGMKLGLSQVAILGALAFLFVLWLLGRAIRSGFFFSEDAILELPFVGAIYSFIFRPPTYYKLDTIEMYQRAVHSAVLEVVDGTMSAKGLRTLATEERLPRLTGPLGR